LRRLLIALVVWLLLALASPAQAQFLSDDFTEGGGNVTLDTHTVTPGPGGTWVEHGSYADDCSISGANDWIIAPAGADFCVYYNDASPTNANYSVEGSVFVQSNVSSTYPGVAGRVATGANTMYRVYYDTTDGRWELYKVVAGSITALGTPYSQALTDSQTYVVKLEMNGTAIKVYIDAVERISVTDTDIAAAGKAAVVQYASGGQQVTSITATDISAGGSTTRSLGLLGVGQ
jgi:hypothetical protein